MNTGLLPLVVFPLFFIGMWLVGTTLLGLMSGWFRLQHAYEAPSGGPLLELRHQWGSMGARVGFGGTLHLAAHRDRLGVGISRFRGPLQRPFLVPWTDIAARPVDIRFEPLHIRMVRLSLGKPALGSLKIEAKSWSQLMESAGLVEGSLLEPVSAVRRGELAGKVFVEWLAMSIAAAIIVFLAWRPRASVGVEASIAIPAVVIGIAQIVRYLGQM